MSDTKMLQAIISLVTLIRQEMKDGFKKIDQRFDETDKKIEKVDKRVTNLGRDIARLEDDAPTRVEHDGLEKRVKKIERKLALT